MYESGSASSRAEARIKEIANTEAWQRRLLPFMISTLALLTIFVVVSNIYQTGIMQRHIASLKELELEPAWESVKVENTPALADRIAWAQWQTLALLESQAMRSRYHYASVAMMGRVYILHLGFATGVVMALVGATFILGKLRESSSSVKADTGSWRLAFQSNSPGLILSLLGTVLILATIWARSELDVRDSRLFLEGPQGEMPPAASEVRNARGVAEGILKQVEKIEEAKRPR